MIMTNEEFSNEFDVLANTYGAKANITDTVFDEYEKSVFLTRAQEQVIEGLYTGKLIGDSFEDTEQLRRYLSDLIRQVSLNPYIAATSTKHHTRFKLKDDTWFITYEEVQLKDGETDCEKGRIIKVVPATQDEFHKIKDNPFRGPSYRRAVRLDLSDNMVDIVSRYTIEKYIVKYIKKPIPIILSSLDGLTINDNSNITKCELNPALHRMILDVAVNMAIKSRVPNVGK